MPQIYRAWRSTGDELEELERTEQEKLRLLDMWSFQRKEIEAAGLSDPGEKTALDNERRVLLNLGRIEESANAAYAALYDSPESAVALLGIAAKRVDELCRIDSTLEGVREHLKAAGLSLEEASYALRDYLGRLEANPGRLEEIEQRLSTLDKLQRKYGNSIAEVLAFLEQVRVQIAGVEHAGERMEELRREQKRLAAEYEKLAAELSERRKAAARKLEKRVEEELAGLAMERTTFRVDISPAAWSGMGADRIAFLVSANVGEEPRPLEKAASGGEISRIALALKTCLAAPRRSGEIVRTLVFDEVDAGIGGSRGRRRRTAVEKTCCRQPGALRHPPRANRLVCGPPLPRRKARVQRPHCRHPGRTRRWRPYARGRAHALGPQTDPRGTQARRAAHQNEHCLKHRASRGIDSRRAATYAELQ